MSTIKSNVQCRCAGGVEYELARRKVKNLNLHIRRDGSVAVSVPLRTTLQEADDFVLAHADWIAGARRRQLEKLAARQAEPLPSREEALARFTALSDQVYPAFASALGGQKPVIKVRDMTSRWGVCSPARHQLTFALQLYQMPPAAKIYVVVHEYCHFLVPNHSPEFWAQVERLLPDWKQRRALLK